MLIKNKYIYTNTHTYAFIIYTLLILLKKRVSFRFPVSLWDDAHLDLFWNAGGFVSQLLAKMSESLLFIAFIISCLCSFPKDKRERNDLSAQTAYFRQVVTWNKPKMLFLLVENKSGWSIQNTGCQTNTKTLPEKFSGCTYSMIWWSRYLV